MGTVAFIPVRGGSKSIPHKNIRPLAGRPLVHWVTRAALAAKGIDHVYVASDSPAIREVAARLNSPKLSVIDRDPATATDTASTESALLAFAAEHEFDRVVLIQATSPLLTSDDLDQGLARLDAEGVTSALSVVREHRFRWSVGADGQATATNYDPLTRPRRQDWDGELVENGAFYVTSRAALLDSQCRISGPTLAVEMAPASAYEIDEPSDWTIIEGLLRARSTTTFGDRARPIELLVTDVDGVLTDAGMFYTADGDAMKKFSTRDGHGIARLRAAGITVCIMTGEDTEIVRRRAEKLGITRLFLGAKRKGELVQGLIDELGLDWHQVAFIGDDVNDLPALHRVGLAACPVDAEPAVQRVVHHICERQGGRGCVREFADAILAAKGIGDTA
ncbi:MAG: YrbI family 3-deoxy-D-manno-octulosonate 8-phosphate phosphatase [Myxococcota bacterium]|jgi:YrbI family 3-deoxy-D-manno-octulosonate 8-phosphate phosphatase